MKRFVMTGLILVSMGMFILSGCGSSSSDSTPPAATDLSPSQPELPNASLLVSAASVQNNIDAGNVKIAAKPNGKLIIIDSRSAASYAAGHIPGAINIQWNAYKASGVLKPVGDLEALLGSSGLTVDSRIVIYDNTTASFGSAGRIFWMLEYLGASDVHILDGGWDKWTAEGRTTETASNSLPQATFTASVNNSTLMDKNRLLNRLTDKDFVIIDSRTDEEFVGWQFYGEPRGGHIPNAVNVPYAWFFNTDKTVLKYDDLKVMLETRGITPDKEVTSYCTAGIRSGYLYFIQRLMGYTRASNYDGSIAEWSADSALPMEKAVNYDRIVSASWVKSLIDGNNPPTYSGNGYVILEASWGPVPSPYGPTDYEAGHIPGALHFDTDNFEDGYPTWYMRPDAELQTVIGNFGIATDTTVVVYGSSDSFGQIAAARIWWELMYAGVTDVRFLNGGYKNWSNSGYPIETQINTPTPTTFTASVHPEYLATTSYVKDIVNGTNTSSVIVDGRSLEEHIGETSGYSYLIAKGRIPGAVWAHDTDYYLDTDYTLRSYTEVKKMWQDIGIVTSSNQKELVFHCGGGWRSSLTYLYAYVMGLDARNYSSGWSEWSTVYAKDDAHVADPNVPGDTDGYIQNPSGNPIETGWPSNWQQIYLSPKKSAKSIK